MNKEAIFRQIVKCHNDRDEYLDKVPTDLQASLFDNRYTDSLCEERDILLKTIFGEHTESIEWFLYEWKPGMKCASDGVETTIYSLDAYIEWIRENEDFV